MSNPAGHIAGLFMSLWNLVSLYVYIYIPLFMSITLISIYLRNIIPVIYHLKFAVQQSQSQVVSCLGIFGKVIKGETSWHWK